MSTVKVPQDSIKRAILSSAVVGLPVFGRAFAWMLFAWPICAAAVVVGLAVEDGAEVLEGSVEVVVDEATVEDEVVGGTDVLVVGVADDEVLGTVVVDGGDVTVVVGQLGSACGVPHQALAGVASAITVPAVKTARARGRDSFICAFHYVDSFS